MEHELDLLIEEIHLRYHYDFRSYSRSSLRRRTEQALVRLHCKDLAELRHQLIKDETLFPRLLGYLTVNTTEFFRDPGYFQSFREKVLPYLMTFPSIKIWVAGCSTGEEVISLSVLLKEAGLKRYMLYATDLNPMNLEKARRGIYPMEAIKKATEGHIAAGGAGQFSDYYQAAYDSVQFDPELLKNVVFADHSLATDSVFSEVHFISCRNVLIYFEKPLQERAISLFDEALVRDGFLGLGNKETLQFSKAAGHFRPVDLEYRIYQKVLHR